MNVSCVLLHNKIWIGKMMAAMYASVNFVVCMRHTYVWCVYLSLRLNVVLRSVAYVCICVCFVKARAASKNDTFFTCLFWLLFLIGLSMGICYEKT